MNRIDIKAALADPRQRRDLLNAAAEFLKELAKEPPHELPCPMPYRVSYVIDVDAKTPMEAALATEETLRHGFYRPHLEVRNNRTGAVTEIDLEDEEVC